MINTILILPIFFCIIILLIKNRTINNVLITLYSIFHGALSLLYITNPEIIVNNKYFELSASNYIFYAILSIVFIAVAFYNNTYSKNMNFSDIKMSRYSAMILIFVLSMSGSILANGIGLAWIFIEATTLASAYLIYFNKTKHSIEAAWKYVFICSIGIALAFVGIILLTIATGNMPSLHYTDLIGNAKNFDKFWLNTSFVFILFGIGTKMGLAPVHFWLPDAHSESPSPVSALLSATLLNCAFLFILNVYKIIVAAGDTYFANIMMFVMGFLSLFVTSVFLYHTSNYKRMLAYSSIENMGILIIATSLGGIAYYAAILHLIGHSLIKASFFLTSGNILELFESKRIKSIKALNEVDKKTAWLWIASFLGICAFPPSLLFISEFLIVKEFLIQKHYILCILFLFFLTIILFGMGKVIFNMVYGEKNEEKSSSALDNKSKVTTFMYIPQFIMLLCIFCLGIYMPKILDDIIRNTIVF